MNLRSVPVAVLALAACGWTACGSTPATADSDTTLDSAVDTVTDASSDSAPADGSEDVDAPSYAADTADTIDAADTAAWDAIDTSADVADVADAKPPLCQPYCGAIGSKSEAWFDGCSATPLPDPLTGNPMWDSCAACVAECKLDGSKSEGWYSSCSGKLIQWANCL